MGFKVISKEALKVLGEEVKECCESETCNYGYVFNALFLFIY